MRTFLAAVLTLIVFGHTSFARSKIGVIDFVSGEAIHETLGKVAPAKVGASFTVGDLFELESGAKLIMKFENGNVITLKSKTKFKVKSYPAKNKAKSPSAFDLIYGTLRALVIQESDEVSFSVQTPSSVTGVRGTDFLVSYDPTLKESRCVTFEGIVDFSNLNAKGKIAKTVRLTAGQISTIVGKSAPTRVKTMPKKKLKVLKDGVTLKKSKPRGDKSPRPKKTKQKSQMKDGASLVKPPVRRTGEQVRDAEQTRERIRRKNREAKPPSPHDPPKPLEPNSPPGS